MLFISLSRLGGIILSTVNELLDMAKRELANLKSGEIFLVRDLFKGYEWNRISRSDRLLVLYFSIISKPMIGVLSRTKRLLQDSRDIR